MSLADEVKQLEDNIISFEERVTELEQELEASRSEVSSLDTEMNDLRRELDELRVAFTPNTDVDEPPFRAHVRDVLDLDWSTRDEQILAELRRLTNEQTSNKLHKGGC